MKILIVDDDAVSRELIRSLAVQMGHTVICAQDGAEAWELYQSELPWLVISDWHMPKIDGLSLCDRIRSCQIPHYTYFILVTAYADLRDDYVEIMDRGVDDFLRKPVDLEDLGIRLKVADRIATYQSRIHSLEQLVTMCAYTKKIKLPDQTWQRIEDFIENTLGLQITHGIDPEYYQEKILPELERLKKNHRTGVSSHKSGILNV